MERLGECCKQCHTWSDSVCCVNEGEWLRCECHCFGDERAVLLCIYVYYVEHVFICYDHSFCATVMKCKTENGDISSVSSTTKQIWFKILLAIDVNWIQDVEMRATPCSILFFVFSFIPK